MNNTGKSKDQLVKDLEAALREIEIEKALERVRARVQGMQESDDLESVSGTLFEELNALGLPVGLNSICISDGETETVQFATTLDEVGEWKRFQVLMETLRTDPTMADVLKVQARGESYLVARLEGEDCRGYHNFWIDCMAASDPDVRALDRFVEPMEGSTNVFVFFSRGWIYLGLIHAMGEFGDPDYEVVAADLPSDEELAMVKRFADVFEFAYNRYLELAEKERQNRALEKANEEIREATRLKSQFLATMSHELRTPMNAIIGFTRLVLRRASNLEDRQRDNLEKVQLSANHLLTLINDILDLSKVEAGRMDLKPRTFRVPPLLQHCCATVGPTLGKRGVELVCEIADDVGEVYADEDRLRQIMINLLSNALKFTEKGEVKVKAGIQNPESRIQKAGDSKVGQMLEISVVDTGIGIPEDKLGTIFEEFRQVDGSSTRKVQGTGLGLAITMRLIELMGGNIGVESEEGRGSTFTVTIPVRYEES